MYFFQTLCIVELINLVFVVIDFYILEFRSLFHYNQVDFTHILITRLFWYCPLIYRYRVVFSFDLLEKHHRFDFVPCLLVPVGRLYWVYHGLYGDEGVLFLTNT